MSHEPPPDDRPDDRPDDAPGGDDRGPRRRERRDGERRPRRDRADGDRADGDRADGGRADGGRAGHGTGFGPGAGFEAGTGRRSGPGLQPGPFVFRIGDAPDDDDEELASDDELLAAGSDDGRTVVPDGTSAVTPRVPARTRGRRSTAVHKTGLFAWVGRQYREFRRDLKKDLRSYGHRFDSNQLDNKPLLLWLVDLPRLLAMWVGFADYRATRAVRLFVRDVRSMPPRVHWVATEAYSPLVAFHVPTAADLDPVWNRPAVRAWLAEFRNDWRRTLAASFAGTAAVLANVRRECAAEFAAVAAKFGAVGRWLDGTVGAAWRALALSGADGGWAFACGTGLAGLTLVALLFLGGSDDRPNLAAAERPANGDTHLVPPEPAPPEPRRPRDEFDWDTDPEFGPAPLLADTPDFDRTEFEPRGDEPYELEPPEPEPYGEPDPPGDPVAADFGGLPNPFDDLGDPPADDDRYRLPEDDPVPVARGRSEPDPFDWERDLPDEPPAHAPPEIAASLRRTRLPADVPPAADPPGEWRIDGRPVPGPDRRVVPAGLNPGFDPPDGWEVPAEHLRPAPRRGGGLRDDGLRDERATSAIGPAPSGTPDVAAGAAFPGVTLTRTRPTFAGDAAADGTPLVRYVLTVRNTGTADTAAVRLTERPRNLRPADADPPADYDGRDLTWDLGRLAAGDARSVTVFAEPEGFAEEGRYGGGRIVPADHGGRATVTPVVTLASETEAVAAPVPALRVTTAGPRRARAGEEVELRITVRNTGDVPLSGVTVRADVPDGLDHPDGRRVVSRVGALAPGEMRTVLLIGRAVRSGTVAGVATVTSAEGAGERVDLTLDVDPARPDTPLVTGSLPDTGGALCCP